MMNATEAVIAVMIAFFMGAVVVGMARPSAIECMAGHESVMETKSNVGKSDDK